MFDVCCVMKFIWLGEDGIKFVCKSHQILVLVLNRCPSISNSGGQGGSLVSVKCLLPTAVYCIFHNCLQRELGR